MTSIKLIALLIFLSSTVAHASLYRWVDENGKVHFSDKVPPSMAQKGHTSLSKNGIESTKVSSAKKLKQEQQVNSDKNVELVEMTDSEKAKAEQQRKDELILATFESKEEVIRVFNKKISKIDQSLGILNARDESLAQKLKRMNQKYKLLRSEPSRMALSMEIEGAKQTLSDYKKAIATNLTNKELVTEQYRHTLIRFTHLTKSDQ